MPRFTHWSRPLVVLGLVGMVVGALDPLEGSFVILAGTVLAAVGAWLRQGVHRRVLYLSCVLVATGVALMVAMTAIGGIGGNTGRSLWWLLVLLPYPIGWIAGLVGAVGELRSGAPPRSVA